MKFSQAKSSFLFVLTAVFLGAKAQAVLPETVVSCQGGGDLNEHVLFEVQRATDVIADSTSDYKEDIYDIRLEKSFFSGETLDTSKTEKMFYNFKCQFSFTSSEKGPHVISGKKPTSIRIDRLKSMTCERERKVPGKRLPVSDTFVLNLKKDHETYQGIYAMKFQKGDVSAVWTPIPIQGCDANLELLLGSAL